VGRRGRVPGKECSILFTYFDGTITDNIYTNGLVRFKYKKQQTLANLVTVNSDQNIKNEIFCS
jgi:hypothetical protein